MYMYNLCASRIQIIRAYMVYDIHVVHSTCITLDIILYYIHVHTYTCMYVSCLYEAGTILVVEKHGNNNLYKMA